MNNQNINSVDLQIWSKMDIIFKSYLPIADILISYINYEDFKALKESSKLCQKYMEDSPFFWRIFVTKYFKKVVTRSEDLNDILRGLKKITF